MQGFFDFLKSFGVGRIAAMVAVTVGLIGFFAVLMLRVTTPQMVPLFTDLAVEDSAAVAKELDRQGVTYNLRGDGAVITVPADSVARLRMKLAEGGLPKGGGVGYEIFDKSDALGATTFIQNINKLRALEGELARTIRSLDRVSAARVHLVLPDRPLFSRDKIEPSASIVLKVRGTLDQNQVRAIRHLVASAVNGMKPERVSVLDETGRLLADGAEQADAVVGAAAEERKAAFERRMREQVENIVTSVVGPGRARVQLTAEFDVNRVTQTTDKFDPEGRVVRSSQTREEQSGPVGNKDEQVSVGNELPGGNAQANNNNNNSNNNAREQAKKSEEIVNYEISRTTKTEVTEAGRVNRISVAVLVDGSYGKNDKGETAYTPRAKEDLDRIATLVRSAIGFDQKRGDQVEVVNLRFAETPAIPLGEQGPWWQQYLNFTKDDIMRGAELGVMALLGLIVMFMVVRPLVRRIVTPEGAAAIAALRANGNSSGGGSGNGTMIGPDGVAIANANASGITTAHGPNVSIVGGNESVTVSNRTSAMIDVAKVQGQVHAESVQKVGELAEKNPQEAVSIIRSWLHEEAA